MRFTYSWHAEERLNERALSKSQLVEQFRHGLPVIIHDRLVRRDLVIDGLDVRVIARRIHKGWHIVTVHYID